jgi:hypothetical protein
MTKLEMKLPIDWKLNFNKIGSQLLLQIYHSVVSPFVMFHLFFAKCRSLCKSLSPHCQFWIIKFPYLRNQMKKIESAPFSYPPYQSCHFTSHNAKQLQFQVIAHCLVLFTGPKLPIKLYAHAMVQLGNGQAIIGGFGNSGNGNQAQIHLLNCMNRNCAMTTLSQELSVPRKRFLAIPIPDTISGCVNGGEKCQKKGPDVFFILNLF